MGKTMAAMLAIARALSKVEEGVACEGTALEKHTVKTGGKAFLFLGAGDALLKLDASLAAATTLATKAPHRYRVGKGGWVKIVFGDDVSPPASIMKKWIAESHSLASAATKSKAKPKKKTAKR